MALSKSTRRSQQWHSSSIGHHRLLSSGMHQTMTSNSLSLFITPTTQAIPSPCPGPPLEGRGCSEPHHQRGGSGGGGRGGSGAAHGGAAESGRVEARFADSRSERGQRGTCMYVSGDGGERGRQEGDFARSTRTASFSIRNRISKGGVEAHVSMYVCARV